MIKKVYIKQKQTDTEYVKTIDFIGSPYTYTETNNPIKNELERNF